MTIDELTKGPVADLGQFIVVGQCRGDPIPTEIMQCSTLCQAQREAENLAKNYRSYPIPQGGVHPQYFVLDDEGKRV